MLKNVVYYAHYYAHKYYNYTTVHIQFYHVNDYSYAPDCCGLILPIMLCYSILSFLTYYAQYYVHGKTCAFILSQVDMITLIILL